MTPSTHQTAARPLLPVRLLGTIGAVALLAGCNPSPVAVSPTPTPTPTPTVSIPLPSLTASPTPSPTATDKPEFTRTLEGKLQRVVTEATRVPVNSVACPATIKATAGDRFDCQATATGQTFAVAVELTNDAGQFKWSTRGLLLLPKLEEFIQTRIKEKGGGDVTTDCGGTLRTVKSGDVLECKVTDAQGQSRSTRITVKDDQGNLDVSLL